MPTAPKLAEPIDASESRLPRQSSRVMIVPASKGGAVSSVGRAPALHAGCHRFESCTAHQRSTSYVASGFSWTKRYVVSGFSRTKWYVVSGFSRTKGYVVSGFSRTG
jgi:hypothetical protein